MSEMFVAIVYRQYCNVCTGRNYPLNDGFTVHVGSSLLESFPQMLLSCSVDTTCAETN